MQNTQLLIAIAPMLDWTDRHCRYFFRLLSPHVHLYTEMITTGALCHSRDPDRFLAFSEEEKPLVVQFGGSDPAALQYCAKKATEAGFSAINLNVGCPSSRVQEGRFGACLMAEPDLVADCVKAMQSVTTIPVTVKTRLGIDDQDTYDHLYNFIQKVSQAGCTHFIMHARKAWLQGLSPKENRTIPPLRYDWVYRLKKDFPQLTIILNGGITSIAEIVTHAEHVDGVMIGRQAYQHPYFIAELSHYFYNTKLPSRDEILDAYLPYAIKQHQGGVRLSMLVKPLLGLFHGEAGARHWRRYLSEALCKADTNPDVILEARSIALKFQ